MISTKRKFRDRFELDGGDIRLAMAKLRVRTAVVIARAMTRRKLHALINGHCRDQVDRKPPTAIASPNFAPVHDRVTMVGIGRARLCAGNSCRSSA